MLLPELSSALPADCTSGRHRALPGRTSPSCTAFVPPLVDLLVAYLLCAGCRAARPGEFTLRGFLAGKLDLTRAEAVLAVIEAAGAAELRQALGQLAGGMARPLRSCARIC